MELSSLSVMLLLISLIPETQAKPKPSVRVNPQSSFYPGDTVTLICDLQHGTGWKFLWYKYNQWLQTEYSEQPNTLKVTVSDAGETQYKCLARRRNESNKQNYYYDTEFSDSIKITARAKPKPSVRVNPQSSVYPGDTVTLICDLQHGTGWKFLWFKNNQELQTEYSEQPNTLKVTVSDAGETQYRCLTHKTICPKHSSGFCSYHHTGFSDPVKITAKQRASAVLSVSPHSWLTEGDPVTLSCEVPDSSTHWTFRWYTLVPHTDAGTRMKRCGDVIACVELVTDGSRGSGGNYTVGPAALHHTGVYMCRGERGEPAVHTHYSDPRPVWVTGESPPVSLIISSNRTQHFTEHSLSLSCKDQRNSAGWAVRRYTHTESVSDCSQWGSVTGSSCDIGSVSTSYTGVYWCESQSGERSNPVNITAHDGHVILESPVHPVTEGHPLTLRCLYRNPISSKLRAEFYKDGAVLQNQNTAETIIKSVSKSDEGFYFCKHPERGESPKSWISIRVGSRASVGLVGLALGSGLLFVTLLILMVLLWSCKRKEGNRLQASGPNPSGSGSEDSRSGHTPLRTGDENIYATVDPVDPSGFITGDAAAESNEATYTQVTRKKTSNRKSDSEADVTYADIKLTPVKKARRTKECGGVADDTIYSELRHHTA